MPSMQHEILVELFRNRPSLAAEMLVESFGVALPPYDEASVASENVTQIQPAEYRADLVIKLLNEGKVVRGNVVEVQLSADPDKRYAWPAYLCGFREEQHCPVDLLVIAPDAAVAKWCAEPIPIGVPGFVLIPPVLEREGIPKVTDPAEAVRRPELALLSAMAYGDSDEVVDIGRAALKGFSGLDPQRACFYTDILYNVINEAARRALEVKMQGYVYKSPFIVNLIQQGVQQGRDEGLKAGRDEGLKEALLFLLHARGIEVPRATREQILGEKDHARLQRWFERAATATSLADVFKEPN